MQKFFDMLGESLKEITKVRMMVVAALLIAIHIVIRIFVPPIPVLSYSQIRLDFISSGFAGYLLGPISAGLVGGIMDVLAYLVRPTGPFFFGYTLSAVLGAAIYGFFLYKKKPTFVRCLIAQAIVNVFVNMGLNTLWMSMMYGKAYFVLLPARIIKNLIQLPFQAIILFLMLSVVLERVKKHGLLKS